MRFKEFFKLKEKADKEKYSEELWMSFGPVIEPGVKRKNANAWLNKRYGNANGIRGIMPGGSQPQVKS